MQPATHRSHRRWRRFLRNNRGLFFTLLLMAMIVVAVAGLFYVLTSPSFAKPR